MTKSIKILSMIKSEMETETVPKEKLEKN